MWALDGGGWLVLSNASGIEFSIFVPNYFAHTPHPLFRIYGPVVDIADTLRSQIETASRLWQIGLAGIDGDRGNKQH